MTLIIHPAWPFLIVIYIYINTLKKKVEFIKQQYADIIMISHHKSKTITTNILQKNKKIKIL